MKKSILLLASMVILMHVAEAQSKTFKTLRNKFGDSDNVVSFNASGFLARTILWMAGEDEFTDAIRDIDNVRLITIPKENFQQANVSLNGFKKLLPADSYEEMFTVKEHGDEVTFYIQEGKNNNNRYLMLVDDASEIVAIEITGFVDLDKLSANRQLTAHTRNEL